MLLTVVFNSCKKPFSPKIIDNNNNLLVVEGFINTGADSTIFKLNRTVLLENQTTVNPETGATVNIESESNQVFLLKEEAKGVYASPALQLNPNSKYRLRIKTAKNSIYLSDFVEVKESPPIDEVGWKITNNGLQIYANTHDASNKTRYYRWEYTDTWIFHSRYQSFLMWNGTSLVARNNNIYQCWGNQNSSTVILGSTAKLENDVIFQSPITLIGHHSEKLGLEYSILVKQYALTKEGYQFYEELKKNTETLGSIFDAQPSEIKGNIHNVDSPSEPVIGYISAGTVQKKRIFLTKQDLTPAFYLISDCSPLYFVTINRPDEYAGFFGSGEAIPIDYAPSPGPGLNIYTSDRRCADCTSRGTNKKPSFWP